MANYTNTELAQIAFMQLRRTGFPDIQRDAIDEMKIYIDELELTLEEQTGYQPKGFASTLWAKMARYYAQWQYLSVGTTRNEAERSRQLFDLARDEWGRAAAIEENKDYFNNYNNRRRMQYFDPNMSEDREVGENELRWDTSDIDPTMDVFSKDPVVLDLSVAASTATPATVFDASADASDPEGLIDVTEVEVLYGPLNGSASVNATTGDITYTSDGGFTGTDFIVARIYDKSDKYTTFKVTITVS